MAPASAPRDDDIVIFTLEHVAASVRATILTEPAEHLDIVWANAWSHNAHRERRKLT